jgi:L-ascorbate metabolism protein UlaG (beta-lactamase superfamily)
VGMRPWSTWTMDGFVVHAVPALHMATTIGFVLQAEGRTVYFAGDTYFRPFHRKIGQAFRPDVALIPVTTYRIPMTMGEKGATRAAVVLQPAVVIPIHLGLQPRSPLLRTRQTPEGFARRLAAVQPSTKVVILEEGESWEAGEGTAKGGGRDDDLADAIP